nr:unnamed protein product [Callosobruchus analis]
MLQQNYAVIQREHHENQCHICSGSHFIYHCKRFAGLSISDKYKEIYKNKLCSNCLRIGHQRYECRSSPCKKCNLKHNTLLHENRSARNKNHENQSVNNQSGNVAGNSYETVCTTVNTNQILLSTATIFIANRKGEFHECTCLLDSGSQSNLLSKSLCEKLGLNLQKTSVPLTSINQNVTKIEYKTRTVIKSRVTSFETELLFLVVPVITERLPLVSFNKQSINYPKNIRLADENFHLSKTIDVLLGAGVFFDLLGAGKIRLGKHMPMFIETSLGWICSGNINLGKVDQTKTVCNLSTIDEHLNEVLVKFWKLEDIEEGKILSREENQCEEYFKTTTMRNHDGRYVVRLPFNENKDIVLGDSKNMCYQRFQYLENRLSRDVQLKDEYDRFMREYDELDHMSIKCSFHEDDSKADVSYFMPHHAVVKPSSTTTKTRVVFDASAKTSSNVALNDKLLIGPLVQNDLFSITLRLRLRKVVLSADIKMMYRQILIHPDDQSYQQIIWRYDKEEEPKVYTLKTVTYGTASAPYLATRCLEQLAQDNAQVYPHTSNVIKTSFYMDDLLVSFDTIEQAIECYRELTQILGSAGFELRKFSSNERDILDYIMNNSNSHDENLVLHHEKELKTLGIVWNANKDCLTYNIEVNNFNRSKITKRTVLSVIAQIYDPFGLIGPVVVKAKCILQELFKLQSDWDSLIPDSLEESFLDFVSHIPDLRNISVNRKVLVDNPNYIEMLGFCDASERAYGCVIYLYSENELGENDCKLLCAKSRVAPLHKVTLPRLELLAAHLLAKLSKIVRSALDIRINEIRLYTDSTIVLSWLKIEPSQLKTFVGNRVAQILDKTDIRQWNHIKGTLNPADIISRGANPQELLDMHSWWNGVCIDKLNRLNDNFERVSMENLPEVKKSSITLLVKVKCDEKRDIDLIVDNYSSLNKIIRIVAYILRFINRTRLKIMPASPCLNDSELKEALTILIKHSQEVTFADEINCIKNSKNVDKNSKITNLHPFIDNKGVLRVGGRLSASDLDFEQRHPIICQINID